LGHIRMFRENVKKTSEQIILLGKTQSGEKFRPSDWAQRLTVAVSTVGPKKQIISHPRVHMAVIDGLPAVVIDPVLEKENPMMFEFLLKFGRNNNLQIRYPWTGEKRGDKGGEEELKAAS